MKTKWYLLILGIVISQITAGQTTIRGKVTDENGEAAIGAVVRLALKKSIGTVTNVEGFLIPGIKPLSLK